MAKPVQRKPTTRSPPRRLDPARPRPAPGRDRCHGVRARRGAGRPGRRKRLACRRGPGPRRRKGHRQRPGPRLSGAHRSLRPLGGPAPQFRARAQSRRAADCRQARRRKTVGAPTAGRRADPGQGQHRHRRQAAHHRRFARAGECARQGRRHGRQAAARGGRGDPGQGEPHGVRQHHRGRDALGLQLAGRPGEEPVLAVPARRSRHPAGAAGRLERGLRRRRRGRPLRGGDRHRDLGLAAEPGDAERRGHREAHGRAHKPRRHPADLAQPGHGRSPHPHRARFGDPPERAGGARSAGSRDAAPAAAQRLHHGPRQGRAEGRAHRRAERSRRSPERCLHGQAAGALQGGDGEGHRGPGRTAAPPSCGPTCRRRAGSAGPARPWPC